MSKKAYLTGILLTDMAHGTISNSPWDDWILVSKKPTWKTKKIHK